MKRIRSIRIQIRIIRNRFEVFECTFELLQIQTIRKGFEAFTCKFKPFETDSKHSNANFSYSKGFQSILMQILTIQKSQGIQLQIQTVRKAFETFEWKFEQFECISKHLKANSNLSKGIRSIRIQIRMLQTRFEAYECKFYPFERNLKHSIANSNHFKGIRIITNANSNQSQGFWSVQTQILTLQKRFEAL